MMTLPRGYRNNNPGNLRPLSNGQEWQGQVGVNSDPSMGNYLVFQTPQLGIRALTKDLITAYTDPPLGHGRKTVLAIMSAYAPSSDDNLTSVYVINVANALGVDPSAPIDFDSSTCRPFVEAIILQELGNPGNYGKSAWYPDDVINDGIAMGFAKF